MSRGEGSSSDSGRGRLWTSGETGRQGLWFATGRRSTRRRRLNIDKTGPPCVFGSRVKYPSESSSALAFPTPITSYTAHRSHLRYMPVTMANSGGNASPAATSADRPERSRNAKAQARHRAKRKAYIEQVCPARHPQRRKQIF